ncbi:MAG: GYF domain-containing protein, partial [Pseudomonadota bacterium]
EQVGPITADELTDRFSRGDINSDTYTWREGFSDWIRLSTVPDFAELVKGAVASATENNQSIDGDQSTALWDDRPQEGDWEDTRRADTSEVFGQETAPQEGVDLFATQKGGQEPEPVGQSDASRAKDGGKQLFPEEKEEPSKPAAMTGQRGENSVLFSLSNLQELAMGSSPAPVASSLGEVGAASGSGSGLIDIRGMAASSASGKKGGGEFPQIVSVAAAPVLIAASGADKPKWVAPVLIALVAVLILVVGALVYFVKQNKEQPPAIALSTAPSQENLRSLAPREPAAKAVQIAKTGIETQTAPKQEEGTPPVVASSSEPVASREPKKDEKRKTTGVGKRKPKAEKKKIVVTDPSSSREPIPLPSRSKSKHEGKSDDLDSLIDAALDKGKQRGKKSQKREETPQREGSEEAQTKLPKTLERWEIQAGIKGVKERVASCFDRYKVPGLVMVKVSIGGNGRIESSSVSGRFAGTPTGSCVQSAVKSAVFPKFRGSPISITYPFNLR